MDNIYHSQPRTEMLQFVPRSAKRILELGCADGSFGSLIIIRNNAEVWGIEPDEDIAEAARRRLSKIIAKSGDEALAALPMHYFDCLICNDVLEHFAFPDIFLKDVQKNLISSATLVGSIPNIRYFPILLDFVWNAEWRYVSSGVLDRTHLRFFTKKSLRRFLTDCGFSEIHIEGINPTSGIRARILKYLSFGFFADCIFQQYAFTARLNAEVNSV